MHLIAPIVLALGLSGALYKTQEVWPYVQYQATQLPGFANILPAALRRREYLKALEEREKQKAEKSKASSGGGATV